MKYRVNVIGYTWEGFESAYTYGGFSGVPDAQQIKRRAGDFQDVTDHQVILSETTVTRKGKTVTTTHKETIVRDWQDEDSAEKFNLSEMN